MDYSYFTNDYFVKSSAFEIYIKLHIKKRNSVCLYTGSNLEYTIPIDLRNVLWYTNETMNKCVKKNND